jgi:two-component system, chemotaxis family, protein-glutamate methylesterase/glutaminase
MNRTPAPYQEKIVVIGGSAGSFEVLQQVVRCLPQDFPAPIFVVIHLSPLNSTKFPEMIARVGSLPAAYASDGEAVEPGRIYVAPPDMHMLVRDGKIELSHGPRENHVRPAIDPTFRTVARAYGDRVIGVVLSGALSDGSLGLVNIRDSGGTVIIQDPLEATFPGMPRAALSRADGHHVLGASEIGSFLVRLVCEEAEDRGEKQMARHRDTDAGDKVIRRDIQEQSEDGRANELTLYTCPDCGGTLWQIDQGRVMQFRCHVGHRWSPEVMLVEKSEQLEASLWVAVRLLTEKATLTRQLAKRAEEAGHPETASKIAEQATLDEEHGKFIRERLLETTPNPSTQAFMIAQFLNDNNIVVEDDPGFANIG